MDGSNPISLAKTEKKVPDKNELISSFDLQLYLFLVELTHGYIFILIYDNLSNLKFPAKDKLKFFMQ